MHLTGVRLIDRTPDLFHPANDAFANSRLVDVEFADDSLATVTHPGRVSVLHPVARRLCMAGIRA